MGVPNLCTTSCPCLCIVAACSMWKACSQHMPLSPTALLYMMYLSMYRSTQPLDACMLIHWAQILGERPLKDAHPRLTYCYGNAPNVQQAFGWNTHYCWSVAGTRPASVKFRRLEGEQGLKRKKNGPCPGEKGGGGHSAQNIHISATQL